MVLEGEKDVMGAKLKTVFVECECGTHMFKINSFNDEPNTFIEIWSENFYNKQKQPIHLRIWNRIKLIWFAIRGKEFRLEDFVISNEDIDKIVNALLEIQKNKQEVKK